MPVEHLGSGVLEDFFGENRGSGTEVEDSTHGYRYIVSKGWDASVLRRAFGKRIAKDEGQRPSIRLDGTYPSI